MQAKDLFGKKTTKLTKKTQIQNYIPRDTKYKQNTSENKILNNFKSLLIYFKVYRVAPMWLRYPATLKNLNDWLNF